MCHNSCVYFLSQCWYQARAGMTFCYSLYVLTALIVQIVYTFVIIVWILISLTLFFIISLIMRKNYLSFLFIQIFKVPHQDQIEILRKTVSEKDEMISKLKQLALKSKKEIQELKSKVSKLIHFIHNRSVF